MNARLKSVVAGIGTALALVVAVPAGAAHATDMVRCDQGNPARLDIDLGGGLGTNRCFANAGALAVNFGGVYYVHAGQYKLTVNYELDGRYHSRTFDPGQSVGFVHNVRVYEVRIW